MKAHILCTLIFLSAIATSRAVGPILSPTKPSISQQCVDATVDQGGAAAFGVIAYAYPYPTFQWRKDGIPIKDGTGSELAMANVQPSDAGRYDVVIVNSYGQVTSRAAVLTVIPPVATIAQQPVSIVATVGQGATFTVSASSGQSLSYQWEKDGIAIPGATGASYSIGNVSDSDAGSYVARITFASGSLASDAAGLTVWSASGQSSRMVAISTRSNAGTAENTLITGFVLSGAGTSPILIRGVGPALAQFSVAGALPDSRLNLYNGISQLIASNDDWGGDSTLGNAFAAAGMFPLPASSKDAALLSSLSPGVYSAHLTPGASMAADVSGIAMTELYDSGAAEEGSRLSALSVRSRVGSGDGVLIVGFVIAGTGPRNLIIRGLGPELANSHVAGALVDPFLRLESGGRLIRTNDNWGGDPSVAAAFAAAGLGALPGNSKDAALVVTLQPGVYTAQLSGAKNAAGVGLIEVYDVP